MWTWIAKLLGHSTGPPAPRPNPANTADLTRPPHESSGTPEDSPAPDTSEPAAVPPAPAQPADAGNPPRLPYPIPAPSRNGTHARH